MSRIYQGGYGDRRFRSSAERRQYRPTQATSNAKKIQQEGQRVLDDLATVDRERQRADQMSNLETSMSDRYAQLDLQKEQIAESGQFKLSQMYDSFAVSNQQLDAKQQLQMRQQYEKSAFQLDQLGASQSLQRQQFAENQELAAKDRQEKFDLGVEARGQSAQFSVDRAKLQADQTVARANTQLMQTAVSSLIKFGMAVGQEVMAKKAEEDQEAKEREAQGMDFLYSDQSAPVTPSGDVNPVITNESNLRTSEAAVEQAVQNQSGGNTVEAENIRQPMADATMDRNLRQANIGEAAINFRPEFDRLIQDPNTTVVVNGQERTLASINNRADLHDWLKGAAVQLTSAFGVDGRDAHAMVMQYGRAAKGAIAGAYSSLGAQVSAAAKQERYDAGMSNAETLMQTGNFQTAWEVARNAYVTSGMGMGKSNKQINDVVFKDMLSRVADPESLAGILKTGQAGTEFGAQREYADMIQKENVSRLRAETSGYRAAQNNTNMQIEQVTQNAYNQLMKTEDPEVSLGIRQQAIAQLKALETPLALDEINRLSAEGKTNNNVYLGLRESFESGNPPSTDEIADAYVSGAITLEQKNEFMKMGMRSDEVNMAISKAGLPPVQKQLEAAVTQALATADVDSTERKGMAAGIVANQLPHVEAELKQYVISNPEATGAEIQKEAARILDAVEKKIFDTRAIDKSRLKKQDNGQFTYDYDTTQAAPIRRNPVTGEGQKVFIQFRPEEVPAGASVDDAYLSRDEFLKAVEVWDAGRQTYSNRIKELSGKLGVSPTSFVRSQARALGYPAIEKVEAMEAARASQVNYKVDPEVKEGLDVIGKYESDSVGGYDAVNQIGVNGGRGVIGYSGDIKNMPQHGGRGLTSMSIKEIMDLQAETGQSNESWLAEGRLHAVGRYQFIGRTLEDVVRQTGIDVNEKFTPEVQDYLAGYLLQSSSNGIGQWVGPSDKASYAERLEVQQARTALQNAYRILRNPRATQVQIARASRVVGNPFI